jgi:hypothetical protein
MCKSPSYCRVPARLDKIQSPYKLIFSKIIQNIPDQEVAMLKKIWLSIILKCKEKWHFQRFVIFTNIAVFKLNKCVKHNTPNLRYNRGLYKEDS